MNILLAQDVPLPLSDSNTESRRETRKAYVRDWNKSHPLTYHRHPVSGSKKSCVNGHPYPESRRPGRKDCAVCHREQELKRSRDAGVPAREKKGCPYHGLMYERPDNKGCALCNRLKTYDMGPAEYDELVDKQQNKCAICGENRTLYIDHDHEFRQVRGLLCLRCNTALGKFDDDENILRKAITYLEFHKTALKKIYKNAATRL